MAVGREVAHRSAQEVGSTSSLEIRIRCWEEACKLTLTLAHSEEAGSVPHSAAAYRKTVEEHRQERAAKVKDLPEGGELAGSHADASTPPGKAARSSR